MALSDEALRRLEVALGKPGVAAEVVTAIDSPNTTNATHTNLTTTNATVTTATITNSTVTNLTATNATATTATITNASLSGVLTAGNGATIVGNASAGGLTIGTNNTQRIALFGLTPIVQPAGTGELIGTLGMADTTANATNMNSNGNVGTKRYSLNDTIRALKQLGVLQSS